jgi:hypothetical protein
MYTAVALQCHSEPAASTIPSYPIGSWYTLMTPPVVCLNAQLMNYPMDYRGDYMKPFVLWRFRVLATLIYYRLRYNTSVYFKERLLGVNMHLD